MREREIARESSGVVGGVEVGGGGRSRSIRLAEAWGAREEAMRRVSEGRVTLRETDFQGVHERKLKKTVNVRSRGCEKETLSRILATLMRRTASTAKL